MKKEYVYAGISIALWSTIATVTKLLLGSFGSMQILAYSSMFAFLFLLIINIVKGNLKGLKKWNLKDYAELGIIGLLGTFFYNLFLFLGMNCMLASEAFIINYLWPMTAIVCGCIILKEQMTIKKAVAVLMSFIGVIIVTSNGNLLQINKSTVIGAFYCILAAVSYGLFTVLNKKKAFDEYLSMMYFYFIASVVSLPFTLFSGANVSIDIASLLGFAWIGIFTSALPITFWAIALKLGDTAKVSNLAYATPFLSLVWTCTILKEPFSIYSVLGLIVIILGILIQLKDSKKA